MKNEKPSNASALASELRSERQFLHDLSSPLMIAGGLLEGLDRELATTVSEKALDKLRKASIAIKKMQDLLQSRRRHLVEAQKETGPEKKDG